MNPQYLRAVLTGIAVLPFVSAANAADLGTAFTYQGFLEKPAGTPVTATCDFEFSLWDAAGSGSPPTGGNQIDATQTVLAVSVSKGVFTVGPPDIDFGLGAFTGDARWMEISVKCGLETTYTVLSPRVELRPAPYALYTPGTMTAVNVRDFGAIADDSMPDTEAINAAIASVPYRGTLFFPPGVYKIDGDPAVVITSSITVMAHGAVLDYGTGTGTAVMVGKEFNILGNDRVNDVRIFGLSVVRPIPDGQKCTMSAECRSGAECINGTCMCMGTPCRGPASAMLSGTGLLLSNLNASKFVDITVIGFEKGFHLLGDRRGCHNNYFETITSKDNLHGIEIGTEPPDGSSNEHFFSGGVLFFSENFSDYTYTKFIYIRDGGINNNRFMGMNLESGVVERKLHVAGSRNLFIGNRYEGTNGSIDFEFSGQANVLLFGDYRGSSPGSNILDTGEDNSFYGDVDIGTPFGDTELRVGIGTMTPGAKLEVAGGGATFPGGSTAPAGSFTHFPWQGDGRNYLRGETIIADNGGRVGIGTNTPQGKLHVFDTGIAEVRIEGGTSGAPSRRATLSLRSDIDGRARGILFEAGDAIPWFAGVGYNVQEFMIGRHADQPEYPDNALLYILRNGNVGIGTTAPSEKLHVEGNICATGTISACSDVRFKDNVHTLGDALGKVMSLRGVEFDWKRDEFPDRHFGEGRQVGFVAQDVEKVLPQVVSKGNDGYLSVDYGRLTPVIVEALRELRAEKDRQLHEKDCEIAELRRQNDREMMELREKLERFEAMLNALTSQNAGGSR